MDASLVLTYRCNSKCVMCNTWKYPTEKGKKVTAMDFEKVPNLDFVNIYVEHHGRTHSTSINRLGLSLWDR